MNVLDHADALSDLGFDCIPIVPGSKHPARQAWQTRPPSEQWQGAPADCNMALRHGGDLQLASMEAERDRPEGIPALRRYLAGLGYDWQAYPANLTAHAGERYFFALLNAPDGHSRRMADDLGGGELRFGPGAYALIPPSVLADGGRYEMVGGAWDGELPKLLWADVAPLLADARRRDEAAPEVAPTAISAFALALEAAESEIADLPRSVYPLLKGKNARTDYPSTEEQRILAILVNAGKSFDACLLLFQRYECFGHFRKAYAKNPSRAIEDLRQSYDAARQWALTPSETVGKLAAAIAALEAQPFKGRTGSTDTAVLLAHLGIAHDAGVSVYAASMRRVAELAGVNKETAESATKRLIEAGQIAVSRKSTPEFATEYSLSKCVVRTLPIVPHKEVYGLRSQSTAADNENQAAAAAEKLPEPETGRVQTVLGHDVFSWHGFGKAAGLVYAALLDGPGTVKELAGRTGRHVTTVRRALGNLAAVPDASTGEVYALVEEDGAGSWQLVEGADLDKAARLLAVDGVGAKRRAKHDKERQRHAAALEAYKDGARVPHPSQNRGDTSMGQGEVIRKARRQTHRERIGSPEADEFRLQAEAMMP